MFLSVKASVSGGPPGDVIPIIVPFDEVVVVDPSTMATLLPSPATTSCGVYPQPLTTKVNGLGCVGSPSLMLTKALYELLLPGVKAIVNVALPPGAIGELMFVTTRKRGNPRR